MGYCFILLELLNGLLKVYDVNTVSLGEDVLGHLGVPLLGRVTEVNACLKQLLDSNFEHFMFLLGFFRHSNTILRLKEHRQYTHLLCEIYFSPRKQPYYIIINVFKYQEEIQEI